MGQDICRWGILGAAEIARKNWLAIFNAENCTLTAVASRDPQRGRRFIADGDYVAVEAQGQNTTKGGVAYNNKYCFVFRVANGKLLEVTEYMDTQLVTMALGGSETQSGGNIAAASSAYRKQSTA